MNTIYSPNNIEVLLHFHSSPHRHPRGDAPAVRDAIGEFFRIGAIERALYSDSPGLVTDTYKTTPLGKAWVQALCNVPPPRMVFVDEHGRIIE